MKLENKTILITGAGSGLGRELAYQLKNNQLILVDINKITLRETILNVENKCIEYIMDCSIEDNWKNLHEFLKSKNALPDIIINNAARNMSDIDIENLDIDDFKTIFNNNFYSVFFGSKEFISDLKSKNSKCAIINISSALGFCAIAKAAAYALAQSVAGLYVAAAFQGLSFAVMTPALVHYVNLTIAHKDSTKGQSLGLGSMTLGNVLACSIGGVLYDSYSVFTVLMFGVGIAFIGAVICLYSIKKRA